MISTDFVLMVQALLFTASTAPIELEWVSLPDGCFVMGADTAYPEEAPAREVCVDGFDMAKTEITNAQFAVFVSATGYVTRAERGWSAADPAGPGIDLPPSSAVFDPSSATVARNLSWWRLVEGANWRRVKGVESVAPRPDLPVVHITRDDAEAYAKWAGGRLPTEAEWEYAARGGSNKAQTNPRSETPDALMGKANTWQGVFPVINSADDGYEDLAPVGSYPANGFGLHDMIGNAWEWTASPFSPSHTQEAVERAGAKGLDPAQPGVAVGTIKGGSYLCAESYCARFRPAARQAQDLAFGTSHIGFRIVRDPTRR